MQNSVIKEHDERKPNVTKKKQQILKISPFVIALSILLVIAGFVPPLTGWTTIFVVIAVIIQAFHWLKAYREWRSSNKVTKYPTQHFSAIHLALLASTEAIHCYVGTADVLIPPK
jgi:heme O synthase-like polyprenyltransferase